jgi:predicted PurR-regulated permease PerM
MMKMPITVRRAIEIMGLFFMGWILVVGKGIIAPLMMAFFISLLLLPTYRFLRRYHFPEIMAIVVSVFTILITFGLIIWFFSSQFRNLLADLPTIRENLNGHLKALSAWINAKTDFSPDEQLQFIDEQGSRLISAAGNVLKTTAGSVTSVFVFLVLLPVYTFLILYYKNLLLRFVFVWFPPQSNERVQGALSEIEVIIKSYLTGLLLQVTYMTILVGGTLLLVGIKHALLIGVIFALLNLIPYIGALIGNVIGVLLTLASSPDLWPIFTVLGVIAGAQFLDNNILMPRIVGAKVKINALAAIVGVFTGGAIAGIMGMFLSLPTIAVLKIIFDRTDNMKQWGVLFGDERPNHTPMHDAHLRKQSQRVKRELEKQNEIEPPNL